MKTKLRLTVLALTCSSLFQSCQKTTDKEDTKQETELVANSEDQALVSGELEAITNELNVPLDKELTGETQEALVCSATLAYENSAGFKKVTITYNGADCAGLRIRSGVIIISMPSTIQWKDVGAQLTVTYQNIKITRVSDQQNITINGTHTLTNVSGGLLLNLFLGQANITHRISSSNMAITFKDGSKSVWQVARQRVYTLANNGTVTITGTHQEGNKTNIAEWGTDRFGQSFTTSITEPLVISGGCQYRLISGKITHERQASSATAVFGLNAQGEPVVCPTGSFYFKLTWTGPLGNSLTYIGAY